MEISANARHYALRELSRRAGVSWESYQRWRIEQRAESLIVRPFPDASAEIHFPIVSNAELEKDKIARKTWAKEAVPEFRGHVPDFIVPFCQRDSVNGEALFVQQAANVFRCTEDILASLLITLCRREESDSQIRDTYQRFPASGSIAARHGFLSRPIVDEYGLAFRQVLQMLIPGWQPSPRKGAVKLSHDIDQVGIPFSLRSTLGHAAVRRAPVACARDFLSLASGVEPGYLHSVRRICRISSQYGLKSALYWKASAPGPFDTGYGIGHPKIARVLAWAKDEGIELGVHPGYETFQSREALREEVQRLREAIDTEALGGRQHYLRWCPETWADWESCGLAYDSSVGFADQGGFRCGTCWPYLPWLWREDRCADLLEIPLVVMDATLVSYMKLNPAQSVEFVQELWKKCELVGGVFTLLWHNTSPFAPYGEHYLRILSLLCGARNYEWENELEELRQEPRKSPPKPVSARA
jgi:hypothetical protein